MKKFFFLCMISVQWVSAELPDIHQVVHEIDRLFRSDTSEAQVSMTITTPYWERTLMLDVWSRGMDETFLVVQSPKKDKGIATLRKKSEMWNYFPKIDKIIKVPPSMMMSSWMGSDFTNDDLVRESSYLTDYTPSYLEDGTVGEGFAVVSLKPKENSVTVWGEIRMVVRMSDYMPFEESYYDEHGEKIRVMYLTEIKELGGKVIPTRLEMVPLTQEKAGNKTTITYLDARFNNELSEDIFSLRNLRKK